jgi:hypothetical protein
MLCLLLSLLLSLLLLPPSIIPSTFLFGHLVNSMNSSGVGYSLTSRQNDPNVHSLEALARVGARDAGRGIC